MTFVKILRREFESELSKAIVTSFNEIMAAFDRASDEAQAKYAELYGVKRSSTEDLRPKKTIREE